MDSRPGKFGALRNNNSMEQALIDIELLLSAYPDEITTKTDLSPAASNLNTFPLNVTLTLSNTAHCVLEFSKGYPTKTNISVSSYRSSSSEKSRMEAAVSAVRAAAQECLEDGVEGGLACCAAAFESWEENYSIVKNTETESLFHEKMEPKVDREEKIFHWESGEPLVDRKSTFQAHVCRITSEHDVPIALEQLMNANTKLRRATHNMLAWRLNENIEQDDGKISSVFKHDNDDDGEDAAGSRLAHLLAMRDEQQTLVVVSRWFGGIHLGPKRFTHITNVARQLLVEWHEHNAA